MAKNSISSVRRDDNSGMRICSLHVFARRIELFVILLFLGCSGNPVSADASGWETQSDANAFDIAVIESDTIFAVTGWTGAVLRSDDAGASWDVQGTPFAGLREFHGISFADSDTGIVVGSYGAVARTTDGGSSWTLPEIGLDVDLWGVTLIWSGVGFAVGDLGAIYGTDDFGESWELQRSGEETLWDVSFADPDTGFVVGGDGTILRTSNGGSTWVSQTSGTTEMLFDVSFVNGSVGTAVGSSGTVLRTVNGGTTWTEQTSGTAENLWGVCFTDEDTGTAVGDDDNSPDYQRWGDWDAASVVDRSWWSSNKALLEKKQVAHFESPDCTKAVAHFEVSRWVRAWASEDRPNLGLLLRRPPTDERAFALSSRGDYPVPELRITYRSKRVKE